MNPVIKKSVKQIVAKFRVKEEVAHRLYLLMDWIYGTNWDKARLKKKPPIPITDKPKSILLDIKFNSPSQELSYLLKKHNIEFRFLSKIV